MDTHILEEAGFTKAEVQTYLALLELGGTKTGPLIRKSNLQSSVVYNCLQGLKEKGLVSWVVRGKVKFYRAADPNTLIHIIGENKKRVQSILPELLVRQKKSEAPFEAEVYEGAKAVFGMLVDWIKDAKPKEEYLFFAVAEATFSQEVKNFFERYDVWRVEKKIDVKGIASKDMHTIFDHRIKKGYLKVRYVDYPALKGIMIFRNMVATTVWRDGDFSAVLVTSKNVADTYREFFYDVWKSAQK